MTVTAVPAQHGPDGTGHLTGPVTGFPAIDAAVLFAGTARTPLVDDYLTLTSEAAVEAARTLGRPSILPVHTGGWAHWTQDGASLREASARAGLAELLLPATPGVPVTV